jgi:hypothetical protein
MTVTIPCDLRRVTLAYIENCVLISLRDAMAISATSYQEGNYMK